MAPDAPLDAPTPVPTDAEGFDRWARDELDEWRLDRVREVAAALWNDPAAHPAWRAVAGIWLAGPNGPSADDLLAAADQDDLPPFFAARLRVVAAAELAPEEAERAAALAAAAVDEVRDPVVDPRSRLAVLRTAAELGLRSQRLGDVVSLLDEARAVLGDAATSPTREAVIIAASQVDLIGAALAHQRANPAPDPAEQRRLVAGLQEASVRQALGTAAMAFDAPPLPAVLSIRLGVCRILLDLGRVAEAEPLLTSVVEATEGIEPALALRYQALLALADVRLTLAGPDAALAVQEQTVQSVQHLGATPMLAWAVRGRALQLTAAGRLPEADLAFGEAVELLVGTGQPIDALLLQLDRAGARADDDRSADAAALVDDVLRQVDGLEDEADRRQVAPQARQLAATLAGARLDHDAAVGHWLALAELAPELGTSVSDPRSAAALERARAGDLDAAEALFDQAEVDAADGPDAEYHLALVMGRRARVRRSEGEHDEAAELLRIAVNHARVAEDVVLLGRLSLQLADALEGAGEEAAAVDALLDARAEGATAGDDALVAAIDARLAALGHTG